MKRGALATHAVLTMPEPEGMFDRSIREIYEAIARRAYELFEQRGQFHGNDLGDWLSAESESLRPVPVEVTEDDDTLSVRAEVPGFNAKDLEIKVEPSRLLIKGKTGTTTERKTRRTVYTECLANEIFRIVNLPAEVNPEKATAVLEDGILQLTLPKAASTKAVRIEVKAAAAAA